MTCTSCHVPSATGMWHIGQHPGGNECNVCHPGVNAAGTAFTDRSLHINGNVEVVGNSSVYCRSCH